MNDLDIIGVCSLCGREMVKGSSVNDHHLIPKTFGGKEKITIHRICHNKIHSLLTERQLQKSYHTIKALKAHPEIQKFVVWLKNKSPTFYARNATSRRKR